MITVEILDKPSNSKGWARYSLECDGAPVVQSRTGNRWVSSDHSGEAPEGARLILRVQVMLRTGQGMRRREVISTEEFELHAADGASSELEYTPGSQGIRLRVLGARSTPTLEARS